MSIEIRKRFMLQFGKAPANEWYSTTLEQALKDYDRMKCKLHPELYEVTELVTPEQVVLQRVDKKLDLLQ